MSDSTLQYFLCLPDGIRRTFNNTFSHYLLQTPFNKDYIIFRPYQPNNDPVFKDHWSNWFFYYGKISRFFIIAHNTSSLLQRGAFPVEGLGPGLYFSSDRQIVYLVNPTPGALLGSLDDNATYAAGYWRNTSDLVCPVQTDSFVTTPAPVPDWYDDSIPFTTPVPTPEPLIDLQAATSTTAPVGVFIAIALAVLFVIGVAVYYTYSRSQRRRQASAPLRAAYYHYLPPQYV